MKRLQLTASTLRSRSVAEKARLVAEVRTHCWPLVESGDFKLEKVVPPGKTVTVTIGPLKPGTYELYDEYHEDESKTKLIAK